MRRQAKKRILIVLGVLVLLLIAIRIALEPVVERYVNHVLAKNESYTGSIDDVDIHLWRGAYSIQGTVIEKRDGTSTMPFLDIPEVDFSVEWKALLQGSVVAEIEMREPKVNFVGGSGESNQAGGGTDWRETVKELVPLKINRFAIVDGEVHYADPTASPKVDVEVNDLDVEATNLTNSEDLSGTLVANVKARGKPLGLGRFDLEASLDPYADLPTFDLNATVKGVPLVRGNDFLKAYGKLDLEAGTLDAYAELASKDGKFKGYVKPLLHNTKVVSLNEDLKEGGPIQTAWEAIAGAAKGLLANDKTENVATVVPIEGSFKDPKVNAWATVAEALRNAFIQALFGGLEGTISMKSVEAVSKSDKAEPEEEEKRGGLFRRKNKKDK
jgi:hypothetical protein